jgi:hypothetical protein
MANSLSRVGSCLAQYEHAVNFCEAKTIIRNRRRTEWRHRMQIDNNLDPIFLLPRRAQTSIFRLRTGHCRLRAHLHRLGFNSHRWVFLSKRRPVYRAPPTGSFGRWPGHKRRACRANCGVPWKTWRGQRVPCGRENNLVRPKISNARKLFYGFV